MFEDYFKGGTDVYHVIPDDVKPGRVLDSLEEAVKGRKDLKVYLVGPEKFMSVASQKLLDLGLEMKDIFLSLERSTLCGIGMCGECACGDRLTCQWGTFQSYEYIFNNARELLE